MSTGFLAYRLDSDNLRKSNQNQPNSGLLNARHTHMKLSKGIELRKCVGAVDQEQDTLLD